jgi:hypothetical protein
MYEISVSERRSKSKAITHMCGDLVHNKKVFFLGEQERFITIIHKQLALVEDVN